MDVILRRISDNAMIPAVFRDYGLIGHGLNQEKLPFPVYKSTIEFDGQVIDLITPLELISAARDPGQARYTHDLAEIHKQGYELILDGAK